MEIRLDLSRHCIETELKRQYNRTVSAYFKSGPVEKRRMEPVIETLRSALVHLDFARLRARYRALCGGTRCKIVLSRDSSILFLSIDDQRIELPDRQTP